MRMDAAANYVQNQQVRIRQNHNEEIRRQMQDQDYQKKMQNMNQRDIDAQQRNIQQQSNAQIEAEIKQLKELEKQKYKEDLDRQMNMKQGMKGFGNMSHAEKQINRQDLVAYKNYETTNHAMIPGINNKAQLDHGIKYSQNET